MLTGLCGLLLSHNQLRGIAMKQVAINKAATNKQPQQTAGVVVKLLTG